MPVRSMTGFGHGQTIWRDTHVAEAQRIAVEIRALNGRFREVKLRQPFGTVIERQVRARIEGAIGRGRVDVTIRCDRAREEADDRQIDGDLSRLDELGPTLARIGERCSAAGLDVAAVSPLEVFRYLTSLATPFDPASVPADVVLNVLDEALRGLVDMRELEGRALERDIQGHVEALHELRARVITMLDQEAPRRAAALAQRVMTVCLDAGATVDATRVAQEVALIVARADVSEELARLGAHLDQIRAILAAKATPGQGKTLDFLAQELVREVTTLGSKVADHGASALVIEAKGIIERFREQVQNVE